MNKNQCIIVFGIVIAFLVYVISIKVNLAEAGSSYYGKVIKLDKESKRLTFAPEGKPGEEVYQVNEVDFMLLTEGTRVRGERVVDGDVQRLKNIWPAREEDEKILLEIQHHLHTFTNQRDMSPMRSVGEMVPDFALYNQDGLLMRSREWKGNYIVAAFIFTRCPKPEMCPATVRRLKALAVKLDEAGVKNYKLAGITMDPAWDTPSVLNAYARNMKADGVTFLTGPWRTMRDLFRQFGIVVKPNSLVILEHTMMIALIDPDGKFLIKDDAKTWSLDTFYDKIVSDAKK